MRSDCIFFSQVRVRFNEVDQQKIVYNGVYITYSECALDDFFRSKGYPFAELQEKYNADICHRKNTIEYFSSAFYGDVLDVGMRIARIGDRSITLIFEIYREGEEDLLVSLETVFVSYDVENRCSRPLAPIMREILENA